MGLALWQCREQKGLSVHQPAFRSVGSCHLTELMKTLLRHRDFEELTIPPAVRLWTYPIAESVVWIELIELPMKLMLAALICV